jgi:hypothetical protein
MLKILDKLLAGMDFACLGNIFKCDIFIYIAVNDFDAILGTL